MKRVQLLALARSVLTTIVGSCAVMMGMPAFAGGGAPAPGLNSWLDVAFLVDNGQQNVANCQDELIFTLTFALGTSSPANGPRSNVRLTIPKPGPTSPIGNGLWIAGGDSTQNAHGTCVVEPYQATSASISAVCDVVGDSDPNTFDDDLASLSVVFVAVATDDPMIVTGSANVPVSATVSLAISADPQPVETVPCTGGGGAGIDVAVSKSDGGVSIGPGGVVPYTLTVVHQGTVTTANVVQLRETVPANSTFVASSSSAGWDCVDGSPAGTICTQNLGFMSPGQSRVRVFAVAANNPLPGGVTQLSNTAIVSASGDTNPSNNSATDTTPIVIAAPDLAITKSDGAVSTVPGGLVSYALTVNNVGVTTATGILVSETVPANTIFNAGASSPGWSCANGAPAGTPCTRSVGSLVSGASAAMAFAVTVNNPVPGGLTQISNTASVADDGANGPDPTPANNQATDTTPLDPAGLAVDLSISKSDGGIEAIPSGIVPYSLGYANLGNSGATGVVLSETVPANTYFNAASSSAGWSCADASPAGTSCTLAIGAVAGGGAGGTRIFAVSVEDPLNANVTAINNTASIAGTEAETNLANNTASDSTPIQAGSVTVNLQVEKIAQEAVVGAGDLLTYDLQVCNLGNGIATGVVLTETVPLYTTFEAAGSAAGWSCPNGAPAGSVCTLTIGDLYPGCGGGGSVAAKGGILRAFSVRVVDPVPSGVTQIANSVVVSSEQPDEDPDDDTDEETTPVVEPVDLVISKDDGGATTLPGGGVAYTLTISNVSKRSATGVVVSETVPANTTFNATASSAGWSCAHAAPATTVCSLLLGGLSGGGATTARVFALSVVDPVPGGVTQIANTATVTDDGVNGADVTPANNTDSDTTPLDPSGTVVDLAISKDDGGVSAVPGQSVVYALTWSNAGNVGATGVVVSETVPANTTFSGAASSPGWSCVDGAPAGSVCTRVVGGLAGGGAGGSANFAVWVTILPVGVTMLENVATIAGNEAESDLSNNTATDSTPLDPSGTGADLSVTKTDGGISAAPGDEVIYALAYANIGNQAASGVVVSEAVPAGTTFSAAGSSPGWSCADGAPAGTACSVAVGALGVGASGSLDFAVVVADPALKAVANVVTIAGDQADLDPSNNTASDSTPIVVAPALDAAIAKDDGGLEGVFGGDVILYNLDWSVSGVGASRVQLQEVVPANSTFLAAASTAGWSCVDGAVAGTSCLWESVTVSAGDFGTVIFSVTTTLDLEGVAQIENTVRIALLDEADTDPSNDEASATTPVLSDDGPPPGPPPVEVPVNAPLALALMGLAIAAAAVVGLRR